MNIQDVVGELLYIGIVAEKGRCYVRKWKFGYKKTLYMHITALYDLQKCLSLTDERAVSTVIEKFVAVCKENYEIGKFYNFSGKITGELHVGINYIAVNHLMDQLFLDLITEMKKIGTRKRKVYGLLCVLHNLPGVYLGKDKETLCGLMQEAVSEQDAIEYAFENMSVDMQKRYRYLRPLV